MKLLSKTDAGSRIKKENEELLDTNIRLRKYEKDFLGKLNVAKKNYDPEKIQALKDFEKFVADINTKKAKLLEELVGIETVIAQRKDLYYGLIEKQDALDEKLYKLHEEEKRLELRIAYVEELEQKQRDLILE